MTTFNTEVIRRVYDEMSENFIEVRPDEDGAGMVEVVCCELSVSITMHPKEAMQVANAIESCAKQVELASVCDVETILRVHNNTNGSFIEIRPDADGLGVVEIASNEQKVSFTMPPVQANKVATAIKACSCEVTPR